jgi:hypothetical protein
VMPVINAVLAINFPYRNSEMIFLPLSRAFLVIC